ncbi:AbfB domain-containing protein [Streptomyces sp. NPDC055952]|uniref:AbfB domain-containing protein n=1 Tax=Streptomyces sp. NPDC055952 TaxID=3345663 RepID=UPI0035D838BF
MSEEKSRPPQDRPWESGWAPDTTRAPGTRRLWLAGALALATVGACVTAVALTGNGSAEPAGRPDRPSALGGSAPGGLISFATPSKSGSASPGARTGSPSAAPTASPSARSGSPSAESGKRTPAPSVTPRPSKPAAPGPPAAGGISVRSVNYPDHYWTLRDGSVRLEPAGRGRHGDATFRRVAGLAGASCWSFATADGRYLRHRDFVLVAGADDGSSLFRQDATFCPHVRSRSGALLLESLNYPGHFLRHRDFQLRLDPYDHSRPYRADASFHLVTGLG